MRVPIEVAAASSGEAVGPPAHYPGLRARSRRSPFALRGPDTFFLENSARLGSDVVPLPAVQAD